MDVYAQSTVPSIQNQRLKFSSKGPFVPTFVESSVSRSSNPQEIYATRVHNRKILLENPLGKREKKPKKKQNAQQGFQRISGSWSLDPHQAKFDLFVPLHHLWIGYMSELMMLNGTEPPSSASIHPKLLKADFSGSFVSVQTSKNPSLVGIQGIVIHESENTFVIITRENKTKVLPKQNAIFTLCVPAYSISDSLSAASTILDIPHLAFTLYGNQFRFRASERAGRKFKCKESIEL
ncbi:RNase P subunit p29-like protein [Gymnopus androsaceus JB14]|uniref:Ribonuclease P protein subunit n=1 Tax=Gymnopus androsaceus JB14 TaxID=1447944 RepID=A0A6A4HDR1_9AGAR|nr:RNase P subunit p29-like protein [Gymnopus androsaceus JB14]